MKKLLLLLMLPTTLWAQTQIGNTFIGQTAEDFLGQDVSLSDDGNVLALSSLLSDTGGTNAGKIQVFRNENNSWVQIGDDIVGSNSDALGYSVSLSSDGNRIAVSGLFGNGNIGIVQILENQNNSWVQVGSLLSGAGNERLFGISVDLSADGNTVAVLCHEATGLVSHRANVFSWQNGDWALLGDVMDDPADVFMDFASPSMISLSQDATRVAIGYPASPNNPNDPGRARVMELQGNTWVQLGAIIEGLENYDSFGNSVSLSAAGDRLAVGAIRSGDGGQVRVFEFIDSNWEVLGQPIDAEVAGDSFGINVELNNQGNVVAVGARFNDDIANNCGQARLFQWNSNAWNQIGSDINGDSAGDRIGDGLALSGNGNVLAVGGPRSDRNGADSGIVEVYDTSGLLSVTSNSIFDFSMHPNPAKEELRIQQAEGATLEKVNIINQLGQVVLSSTQPIVPIAGLPSGLYYVTIEAAGQRLTKKLIKY